LISLIFTNIRNLCLLGDDFTSFFEPIEGFLVFGNASNIAGQIAIMDAVPSVQIWPGFLDLYSRGAKAIIYVTDTRKLQIVLH
jgi:hypothetical protein